MLLSIYLFLFFPHTSRNLGSSSLEETHQDTNHCHADSQYYYNIICRNVNASYLKSNAYVLENSLTIKCIDCQLPTITRDLFNLAENKIKKLILSHNNISFIESKAFEGLDLGYLDLGYNYIEQVGFDTFHGLNQTEYLSLDHNSLNYIYGTIFFQLSNLKVLILSHNKIKHIEDEGFEGLTTLKELHLESNKLKSIHAFLGNLSSLEFLDLTFNRIASISYGDISILESLKELKVAHNFLTHLESGTFKRQICLKSLDFSYNSIDKLIDTYFVGLQNLENLDAKGNKIFLLSNDTFRFVRRLRYLDISCNDLKLFELEKCSYFNQLNNLNLSHNSIGFLNIRNVSHFPNIISLDLSYNNLSMLDCLNVKQIMPKVSYIGLTHNKWPCDLNISEGVYVHYKQSNLSLLESLIPNVLCNVKSGGQNTPRQECVLNKWYLIVIFLILLIMSCGFYGLYRSNRFKNVWSFVSGRFHLP